MQSPLQQIRASLHRYLDGQIELYEFEDIFLPLLWEIDSERADEASEFAGRIQNLLSEHSRGDRTEASMRDELEQHLVSV